MDYVQVVYTALMIKSAALFLMMTLTICFWEYADDEFATVAGGQTQMVPDTGGVMRTSVIREDQRHASFNIA
ncbi:hypothetical protein BJ742DRAFT_769951 [Cladochytrium replicatum]|nr:hypothetical protein BJ742DRAFT_769951 [Cladochytrium replicatum]